MISSDASRKRKGNGRVPTDMMENINLRHNTNIVSQRIFLPLFHQTFEYNKLFLFKIYSLYLHFV
jgi:hypothetical protein